MEKGIAHDSLSAEEKFNELSAHSNEPIAGLPRERVCMASIGLPIAKDQDVEKQAVAHTGVGFIEDGHIVGLGSGSTAHTSFKS